MLDKARAMLARMEEHPKFALFWQFVKFGVVGVSNTLINLGVYYLCFYALSLDYQLANFLAFLVSVTNAYYWNSRFVFKTGVSYTLRQHLRAYAKAFLSYGATYLLSAGLLHVWVELCGVSEGIAPLINLLITIPLNFLLNKTWAFRS